MPCAQVLISTLNFTFGKDAGFECGRGYLAVLQSVSETY